MSTIEAPLALAHFSAKNRVIRSATHSFLPDTDGKMTDAEYAMYGELAKNGVGTIITGHCCVDPLGRANKQQVNIYADHYLDQFTRAAQIVHAAGVRFVPQISHAGPRSISTDDLADVSARPLKKNRHARELTIDEIQHIERQFITAAVRLKKARVDGVQLHAAHSYLLSRFLDPTFNERTDEYGGSAEHQFRIVREIVLGIKDECGADFPVFVKINLDTEHEDKAGYEKAMLYYLNEMKKIGVDLVELSGVDFINQPKTARLYYLEQGAKFKQAAPSLPMSLVGGVRSLADMEKVLASGFDAVSLSRALIAEPDFLKKSLAGGEKSICVSCSRCFVLPEMHPGFRCVWAWKKHRAALKQAKG